MKKKHVFLTGVSVTGGAHEYRVTKLVNLVEPEIGLHISTEKVKELIAMEDVEVNIQAYRYK